MTRSLLSLPISISIFLLLVGSTLSHGPHAITVRSPDLSPDSLAWDRSSQHFVVASSTRPSLYSVSDAGVVQTLVSDPPLPQNASVLAVFVDSLGRRLLALIHPVPNASALVAYDLSRPPHHPRLFLSLLGAPTNSDLPITSAVAVDSLGNAYVTNSAGNSTWKIDMDGRNSVFSDSLPFSGIAYVSKGYFLAVQSSTGKIYKIDGEDGVARVVLLPKDLPGAAGIAIRSDETAVVVSRQRVWFLKSDNGWAEAAFYDEIALDEGKLAKGVAIREGRRAYVLYGNAGEGIFGIEEVESERDRDGENVWMLVLVGFGLAYFMYWRFQMGRLVKELNKKRE